MHEITILESNRNYQNIIFDCWFFSSILFAEANMNQISLCLAKSLNYNNNGFLIEQLTPCTLSCCVWGLFSTKKKNDARESEDKCKQDGRQWWKSLWVLEHKKLKNSLFKNIIQNLLGGQDILEIISNSLSQCFVNFFWITAHVSQDFFVGPYKHLEHLRFNFGTHCDPLKSFLWTICIRLSWTIICPDRT